MFIVYCAHLNNKHYIGKTNNFIKRKCAHKNASKKEDTKFYRAIRKHGFPDNWEILWEGANEQEALQQEIYWIALIGTMKHGYNSTIGGDGVTGYRPTKEAKQKSALGIKQWHSENGHPMAGKHHSNETRALLSSKLRGRVSNRKGALLTMKQKSNMTAAKPSKWVYIRSCDLSSAYYFRSVGVAARFLGVDRGGLRNVAQGRIKQCNGFFVEYV